MTSGLTLEFIIIITFIYIMDLSLLPSIQYGEGDRQLHPGLVREIPASPGEALVSSIFLI